MSDLKVECLYAGNDKSAEMSYDDVPVYGVFIDADDPGGRACLFVSMSEQACHEWAARTDAPLGRKGEVIDSHSQVTLGWFFPAGTDVADQLMDTEIGDDGRSGWFWLRLGNGDLVLTIAPCGDTYFGIEELVERDWDKTHDGAS